MIDCLLVCVNVIYMYMFAFSVVKYNLFYIRPWRGTCIYITGLSAARAYHIVNDEPCRRSNKEKLACRHMCHGFAW